MARRLTKDYIPSIDGPKGPLPTKPDLPKAGTSEKIIAALRKPQPKPTLRPGVKPKPMGKPLGRSSGGITGPGGKQVNPVYNTY